MSTNKILILGKIPPPVGGVTIHVSGLLQALKKRNFRHYDFLDLALVPVTVIVRAVLKYPVTHLHTSHVYFQLMLALLCFLTNRRLIITYHGNLGRYRAFKNLAVSLSCRLCYLPIVQNEESLEKAIQVNSNAIQISSYIPIQDIVPFNQQTEEILMQYKQQYKYIFCTNACNLTFDKMGNEIYGITELVEKFAKIPQALLIISDPSEKYAPYISDKMTLPSNVRFFSHDKAFARILCYAHAFIRNSTTDGDSISIHEAITAGITVFASDVVPRPPECILYQKISQVDLLVQLRYRCIPYISNIKHTQSTTTVIRSLINLYYNTLN